VRGRQSAYARSLGGLLAGLIAVGAAGYAAARGISGPAPSSQAGLFGGAHVETVAGNGADFGFTGSCGVERHDVKDLLDGFIPGAVQDSSISQLRALPVPPNPDAGRTPPEQVVYRVQALALADKVEADSDIHLAIADPAHSSETMIAEFPAASCLAQSSEAPELESARADLVAALGDPSTGSSYNDLSPPPCVTLTGVAFFDRIHGQRGVAPNGIELHPVLAFQAGCAVPAPPPATTSRLPQTTPEQPDTTPVTTEPLPTVSVPTTTAGGSGCDRYPGRHWFKHRYHADCQSYYFTTP
jgi:hypothetical protein